MSSQVNAPREYEEEGYTRLIPKRGGAISGLESQKDKTREQRTHSSHKQDSGKKYMEQS